jgi:hypothetical protein
VNTSQSTTSSFAIVCALQLVSKDSSTPSGRVQLRSPACLSSTRGNGKRKPTHEKVLHLGGHEGKHPLGEEHACQQAVCRALDGVAGAIMRCGGVAAKAPKVARPH